MKLHFINHSSVLIEVLGRRLLCDLWLDGRAFDDGWALLAQSVHRYADLKQVTDLWFSHEHPDHFNPPNLKQIPPEVRTSIRVLYQQTIDHRVVDFCRGLGFGSVEELPPDGWWTLAPGVELYCRPHAASWGEGDSWIALRSEGKTILNVNDCEIDQVEQARDIAARVGPVDVLLSQFSYASWQGNESAVEGRRRHARELVDRLKMRIDVFKPEIVVPFASFVRFCHEENVYLNQDANRVEDVAALIERETSAKAVVLYPGDVWEPGRTHDSARAIERYQEDWRRAETEAPIKSRRIEAEALVQEAQDFCQRLTEGIDPRVTRLYLGLKTLQGSSRKLDLERLSEGLRVASTPLGAALRPAFVYVRDLDQAFAFDLDRGLRSIARARGDCDIELGSEALSYCFRFPWGGETLQVNGRFREPGVANDTQRWTRANRLLAYFRLARRRSFGYQPSAGALAGSAGRRARSRLSGMLGPLRPAR